MTAREKLLLASLVFLSGIFLIVMSNSSGKEDRSFVSIEPSELTFVKPFNER